MPSLRTKLSLAAVGMVASYNALCWLPASIWAFAIASSTGLVFLLAVRPLRYGAALMIASMIVGVLTARMLPDGYTYYFVGFTLMLVALPSAIMAAGIRNGISAHRTQLWALLPISILLFLYVMNVYGAATLWREVIDGMSMNTVEWYSEAINSMPGTISAEEAERLKGLVTDLFNFLYRFTPGLLITLAAAVNIASYFFAGKMIRVEGGFYRRMMGFGLWKAGVIHMALLAVGIVTWMTRIEAIIPLSENLLFLLGIVYMVAGFSVIDHYLKKYRIHAALRTAFVVALILSGWFGGLLAAIVGLVDSHFDFRRVRAQQIG